MAKLLKSANFRSIYATGVYMVPSGAGLRFVFIDYEPAEGETDDGNNQPVISEAPYIQAEVIVERGLAKWVHDYLEEWLKTPPAATRGKGEVHSSG